MIVDKSESLGFLGGESAWTKLLNESPSDVSEKTGVDLISSTDSCCQQEVSEEQPLNCQSQQQLLNCHLHRYSNGQVNNDRSIQDPSEEIGSSACGSGSGSANISIYAEKDEEATDTMRLNGIPGEEKTVRIHRKESILGTFNKHLRRSIKAVSESPGPITR